METKDYWQKRFKEFPIYEVIEPEQAPEFSDHEMHDFLKKTGTFLAGFAVLVGLLVFLINF